MPLPDYHKAKFYKSVAQLSQLPEQASHEVAFVGRSNSGKSSVLNALTQQSKLAKTSKTPGRTQLINYFSLTDQKFLVDLPGYGFAKATANQQAQWSELIDNYLNSKTSLLGIIQIMDIRHPLTHLDQQMLAWSNQYHKPIHILLNKADKLSKQQQIKALNQTKQFLLKQKLNYSCQVFSALKKIGLEELTGQLDQWLEL